ncbi:MAG TPA: ribonuclease domain-containing protein [Burkholderiales bacterium]
MRLVVVRTAALLALAFAATAFGQDVPEKDLPAEARQTLEAIKSNGPFPYQQDGATFANREKRLPLRTNGYYREYTVRTPGAKDRGPRRIIAGNGGEFYYSGDHYRTFRRIRE